MNEREMRAILGDLCAEIDAHVADQERKRTGRTVVAGAVLGLTLGMVGCLPWTEALYAAPEYGVAWEDAGGGQPKVDAGLVDAGGEPVGAYGAPPDAGPVDAGLVDAGGEPVGAYGAPPDAGN
jgi:hypothetical protein